MIGASVYMTREEAAEYLRTSVRNLTRMKCPRYRVFGKRLYKRDDLDSWMKSNLETSPLDAIAHKVLAELRCKPAQVKQSTSGVSRQCDPLPTSTITGEKNHAS